MDASLDRQVISTIGRHPAVRNISLAGSRAEGRATAFSDWDFVVATDDFPALARDLPDLCAPLAPLAEQWDRLSPHQCWMLMLRGPTKIDLILPDEPHELEPPWEPSRENLAAIDVHFWDWALWLRSKEAAGKRDLVATELEKLFHHLLGPLGATDTPDSVAAAVSAYRDARAAAERRFSCEVPRELEAAVADAVARAG
jgi:predicted nucleotidyltransferase